MDIIYQVALSDEGYWKDRWNIKGLKDKGP